MADSHNYSPSELIDLFIDNEATSTEQSVLFAALSRDDELQAEFAEAMRIRSALEQDRADVQTPIPVAQNLFTRAGMTPPASLLTGTSAIGSGAGSNDVPVGAATEKSDKNRRRNWPVPIAMVGGLLLGAMLMYLWFDGGPGGAHAESQNGFASVEGENSFMADSLAAMHSALHSALAERTEFESKNLQLQRELLALSSQRENLASAQNGATAAFDSAEFNKEVDRRLDGVALATAAREAELLAAIQMLTNELAQANSRAAGSENAADADAAGNSAAMNATRSAADVLLADFRRADQPMVARVSADALTGVLPQSESLPSPLWTDSGLFDGISFQIRGLENLEWYPLRSIGREQVGPWFNNLSMALMLNLDDTWSLGIEGGQETFPLYIADDSELGFSLEERHWWLGAAAEMRLPLHFVPIDVDVLTQLGLAGSRSGPLGRLYTALSWQASERISFDVGLDGSMLFYQLDGQIFSAAKLGAAYGMRIKF